MPELPEVETTCNGIKPHILNKKICIKKFLMDSKIVVGIGNIYANEILFILTMNHLTMNHNCRLNYFL